MPYIYVLDLKKRVTKWKHYQKQAFVDELYLLMNIKKLVLVNVSDCIWPMSRLNQELPVYDTGNLNLTSLPPMQWPLYVQNTVFVHIFYHSIHKVELKSLISMFISIHSTQILMNSIFITWIPNTIFGSESAQLGFTVYSIRTIIYKF